MNTRKTISVFGFGGVHMSKNKNTEMDLTMGMTDSEMTETFRRGVKHSIRRSKAMRNPVAKYDPIRKRAYLEYPDGSKDYV